MRGDNNSRTDCPTRQKSRKRYLGNLVAMISFFAIVIAGMWLFFSLSQSEPEQRDYCLGAGLIDAKATGPTSATVYFCRFSGEPSPMNLKIVLQTETSSGNYIFPSNETGTNLVLEFGHDLGTIEYVDLDNDEKVDLGDRLLVTNLVPGSDYSIKLLWKDGSVLDSRSFSTPTD